MKLYAIRDKLIDYYLRPFTAEDDKNVIASLAETINNVENKTPIAQTPSHFEIWRLAEIDQDSGAIAPSLELIADCASLVRRDLRETVESRKQAIREAADRSPGTATGSFGLARANGNPLQADAPTEGQTTGNAHLRNHGRPEPDHREPVRDHTGGRDYKY